jgi:hypothetical protein
MPSTFGVQVRNIGPLATAWVRGLQQQLYQAPGTTIEGVKPSNWPSAGQPVAPFGRPTDEPLAILLQQAMNLMFTPRSDAQYTAKQLKGLAAYPLARICIDNTKDIIGDIKWNIQQKPNPGETKAARAKRALGDTNLVTLSNFFEYPDKSNRYNWAEWTRQLIDELLTIDAPTMLVRKNRKGLIAELPVIPGDTIARYVDDNGWTPKPPSPAYAQLWEGIPRLNLTTDQLIYKPRNIVWRDNISSMLYGCGPTESLATELEVGWNRLKFVHEFYVSGNLPNALQIIPADTPPDKVKAAFQLLDSELSGNLAKRRGLRPVQGFTEDGKDIIHFPEQPVLSDAFDDLHIRKVCFGYGTSPQRLMRMIRAQSDANQESAEEEGLMPWLTWIRGIVNYVIQMMMGYTDYVFEWEQKRDNDIVQQMTADTGYVKTGVKKISEVRDSLDLDPVDEENANKLGILGPTGFIALDQDFQPPAAPTGEPIPRGARTPPQSVEAVEDQDVNGKKVLKLVLASPRPVRSY